MKPRELRVLNQDRSPPLSQQGNALPCCLFLSPSDLHAYKERGVLGKGVVLPHHLAVPCCVSQGSKPDHSWGHDHTWKFPRKSLVALGLNLCNLNLTATRYSALTLWDWSPVNAALTPSPGTRPFLPGSECPGLALFLVTVSLPVHPLCSL